MQTGDAGSSDGAPSLSSLFFRDFSGISASRSLFLRVGAGCAIARKQKEKPLESCVIPTV